ncbi:MAG: tRNA dihydrouridine synthase DusB [Planctomycetota bacterium]
MFKIGNIELSAPIILAPMSGVSDFPFRTISRSLGCEFAFLEMISARALAYRGRKTFRMITTIEADKPLGIQLLGADLQYILKAMDIINGYDFEIIDFNAACPVPKVIKRGEGASLLKEPKKLREILKVIVEHSKKPVSLKIRSGWNDDSINAVDVALYAQDAGIKYLFIHGRTKVQGYSGRVDYRIIKKVKEALNIPVIGSGDALSPQLIKKMFDETGCDAVTIARGALGNPWIFPQTAEFLKSGILSAAPALDKIADTMIKHFNLCCDYHGERIGVIIFRKFFYWYTRKIIGSPRCPSGLPEKVGEAGIKTLRNKVVHSKTKEQVMDIINELVSNKL